MKKKIAAGSVEELMEIVKAIQNGEEPDEALRRKREEEMRLAADEDAISEAGDSEPENSRDMQSPKEQSEKKSTKKKKEKKVQRKAVNKTKESSVTTGTGKRKDEIEDDEFDRLLDEDDALDFRPVMAGISAGAGKVSGFFRGLAEKANSRPAQSGHSEQQEPENREKPEQLSGRDSAEEEKIPAANGDTGEETADTGKYERRSAREASEAEKDEKPHAEESGKDISEPSKPDRENRGADTSGTNRSDREKPDTKTSGTKGPDSEKSDTKISGTEKGDKESRDGKNSDEGGPDAEKSGVKKALRLPKFSKDPRPLKARFEDTRKQLVSRGIRRREAVMLAIGAVLLVMIFVMIGNGISVSLEEKKKSVNVTADEGLTVTVEQQPENWSRSYPVVLKIRTKGEEISQVTVNGEDYTPDAAGLIVVNTSENLLQAVVQTAQGELHAQIEIPMIDSQPPVLNITKEQNQVIVTAADAASGKSTIYYAVVDNNAFNPLPKYGEYSDPLPFEENKMYYFYARDTAGNECAPVKTTMETASAISFAEEEVSLFPNETVQLSVSTEPAGAILNNLKYESANPDVAAIDSNGKITAAAQGSTMVKASAEGVSEISCKITVDTERSVTISAIGDCTLGTDEAFNTSTNFDAFDVVNGHSYFFKNVKEILENDDVTYANLEGTFTTSTTREQKEYAFKGDPSYTEILQDGSVEVVTLANNHSSDYGSQSLSDTKSYLAEAGIDYCQDDEIVIRDVNGIRTAFIGIYELNEGIECESRVRSTISQAKTQGAQLIIIAFHWGAEKATTPDETQRSLAHTAVDCGADLVVGHHPHVLEGIEKYNGKYIVYSLGNFCFGGNSQPSDMDTMIFRQTFTITQKGVADDDQIEIIPCSISSAAGYNNFQPTPATGSEAERIISRLNEYSSEFGQSFTASTGLD